MTRIWRIGEPYLQTAGFATVARTGTWVDVGICPACTAARDRRAQPMVIEWERRNAGFGDLLWPGLGELAVSAKALSVLERFSGFEPGPVVHADDTLGRAWVKDAPEYHEVWVTTHAGHDPARSSARLADTCVTCGKETWELSGHERVEGGYDREARAYTRAIVAREPGRGIFVHGDALAGADIFRIRAFPSWLCVTDAVREACEGAGFDHIEYLELGEVV